MTQLHIPWAPRVIMVGRVFRLPVVAADEPALEVAPFQLLERRFSNHDNAFYFYLKAPREGGAYVIRARQDGQETEVEIGVCSLEMLRRSHVFNGAQWPRRWPLGEQYRSVKRHQTLQDMPVDGVDEKALAWWRGQDYGRKRGYKQCQPQGPVRGWTHILIGPWTRSLQMQRSSLGLEDV